MDDIARVTEQNPLPAFTDESVRRLKDIVGLKNALTGVDIKLTKYTGVRKVWKVVTLARTLGTKAMVGYITETSCVISTALQLSPAVDFANLDDGLLTANDRFRGMEAMKGRIILPNPSGIGIVRI